jgi:hypothetical protein
MLTGPPSGAPDVSGAPLRVNSGWDTEGSQGQGGRLGKPAGRCLRLFAELNPLCSLKKIRPGRQRELPEGAWMGLLAYWLHYPSHRRFRLQVRP